MDRRIRWLIPFAVFVAACSGAAETDLLGPSTDTQTNATDPGTSSGVTSSSSSGESSSGATSSSGSTSSSGATSSGESSSGNTSSGSSGNDAGPPDAGPPPCVAENEDNDSLDEANPFTTRFCGKIDARSDLDFGEIQLPPNTTSFAYKATATGGNVLLRIYANGVGLPPTDGGGGEIKTLNGVTYAVRVSLPSQGPSSARPTYEVDVTPK